MRREANILLTLIVVAAFAIYVSNSYVAMIDAGHTIIGSAFSNSTEDTARSSFTMIGIGMILLLITGVIVWFTNHHHENPHE